jgi:hypothetical protein
VVPDTQSLVFPPRTNKCGNIAFLPDRSDLEEMCQTEERRKKKKKNEKRWKEKKKNETKKYTTTVEKKKKK